MKVGNECHADYSHIMGNSQKIGVHGCRVSVNGRTAIIPAAWLTRNGRYKARYRGVVQSMIRGLHEERIAA